MNQLMSHLGHTRTRVTPQHALIAPDGHVMTALPGWKNAQAIVLISPQMGARHSHYLVEMTMGAGAGAPLAGVERFVYVLEGQLSAQVEGETYNLEAEGFIYLPADTPHTLTTQETAKLTLYERRHISLEGYDPPPVIAGNAQEVAGDIFLGDKDVVAKKFLPDDPRFDMAVNTMTFQPGATLPFAETHFMEHGALLLSGGGVYRLNDNWYPVQTGDALWMGPYCPQWFGALGKEAASYLLYKETNRDVFTFEKES